MRRLAVVLAVVALLLAFAAPAAQACGFRTWWGYRAVETTDGSGIIHTYERKCLRFHGQKFCTKWRYTGYVVR